MKRAGAWLISAVLVGSALVMLLAGCGGTKPREALPVANASDDGVDESDKGKAPVDAGKGTAPGPSKMTEH